MDKREFEIEDDEDWQKDAETYFRQLAEPERKDHKRIQRERRRALRHFRRFDTGGVDV